MNDDEIMLFNEELMAKINKREVQPLENDGEKSVSTELISEFIKGMKRAYKMKSSGLCRTAIGKEIEKWEKIKDE